MRVRRAFALALDRDVIADAAFAGEGKLDPTFFPESSPYYDPSLTYPELDLAEAQRLIDEYLAETGTESIDVEVIGLEGQMGPVGVSAQQQLAALNGVNLEVSLLPPLGLRDRYFSGSFDIATYLITGVPGYPELKDYLSEGSVRNIAGWTSPEVDEALATIIASDDQEVINAAYGDIGSALLDQVPYLILWKTDVRTYAQDNVANIQLYRDHIVDLAEIYLN